MTTTLDPAPLISCESQKCPWLESCVWPFFLYAETPLLLIPFQNLLSPSFSAKSLPIKVSNFLAIWQGFSWHHIFTAHMQNGHFQASGCNSDNDIGISDSDFYKTWMFRQSEYIFSSFRIWARNLPHLYFWSTWPNFIKSWSYITLLKGTISTKFVADPTIHYQVMTLYWQYAMFHCDLDNWPFDPERLSWTFCHAI